MLLLIACGMRIRVNKLVDVTVVVDDNGLAIVSTPPTPAPAPAPARVESTLVRKRDDDDDDDEFRLLESMDDICDAV